MEQLEFKTIRSIMSMLNATIILSPISLVFIARNILLRRKMSIGTEIRIPTFAKIVFVFFTVIRKLV